MRCTRRAPCRRNGWIGYTPDPCILPRVFFINPSTLMVRASSHARGTRGGTIFLCSIQQSRPTRGRPGHMESYPNPSVTNGKPSRRPAVTAHMPHVPPEHPNLHSRSATASERLGFPLATDGLRMLHVPPTGSRYYRGYPSGQNFFGRIPRGL